MITIRIAGEGDSHEVSEIGRLTFYETWRAVNTEEDMQLYMAKAFDEKKIKNDLANTAVNIFLLASINSGCVGYAKMRNDNIYDEFKGENAIEIERIYVKKEYQEQKGGKQLMDRCIELAISKGNNWIWLAVSNENYKALGFYKKYGFETFGTRKFILGTAIDEDLLMKLKIQ